MSVQSIELTLFTAVVHVRDGVLFEAAADSPHNLVTQVAGFVRERCTDVLWPDDADQVCRLLEQRNAYAAIALYFARVGDRWDEEWLELSLPQEKDKEERCAGSRYQYRAGSHRAPGPIGASEPRSS